MCVYIYTFTMLKFQKNQIKIKDRLIKTIKNKLMKKVNENNKNFKNPWSVISITTHLYF